jgi:hypothetical protein
MSSNDIAIMLSSITIIISLISLFFIIKSYVREKILILTKNEIKKSYENYQGICPYPNGNYRDIFE